MADKKALSMENKVINLQNKEGGRVIQCIQDERDQIQKFKMIDRIVKFDHQTIPFKLKEMQIEDKLQSIGHGSPQRRERESQSSIENTKGENTEKQTNNRPEIKYNIKKRQQFSDYFKQFNHKDWQKNLRISYKQTKNSPLYMNFKIDATNYKEPTSLNFNENKYHLFQNSFDISQTQDKKQLENQKKQNIKFVSQDNSLMNIKQKQINNINNKNLENNNIDFKRNSIEDHEINLEDLSKDQTDVIQENEYQNNWIKQSYDAQDNNDREKFNVVKSNLKMQNKMNVKVPKYNGIVSESSNSIKYPFIQWQRAGTDVYDCIQNPDKKAKLGFPGETPTEVGKNQFTTGYQQTFKSFWKDSNIQNENSYDFSQTNASTSYATEPIQQYKKFKTIENNDFNDFFASKYRKNYDLYNGQNILKSSNLNKNAKNSKLENFLQTLTQFSNQKSNIISPNEKNNDKKSAMKIVKKNQTAYDSFKKQEKPRKASINQTQLADFNVTNSDGFTHTVKYKFQNAQKYLNNLKILKKQRQQQSTNNTSQENNYENQEINIAESNIKDEELIEKKKAAASKLRTHQSSQSPRASQMSTISNTSSILHKLQTRITDISEKDKLRNESRLHSIKEEKDQNIQDMYQQKFNDINFSKSKKFDFLLSSVIGVQNVKQSVNQEKNRVLQNCKKLDEIQRNNELKSMNMLRTKQKSQMQNYVDDKALIQNQILGQQISQQQINNQMYQTNQFKDKNQNSAFKNFEQIDEELEKRVVPEQILRDQRKQKDMYKTQAYGFTLIS